MFIELARRLPTHIGLRDLAVLEALAGDCAGWCVKEIARHVGISAPAVVRILDSLGDESQTSVNAPCQKLGWVRRYPDAEDRRKTRVELTQAGREAFDTAAASVRG